MSQPVHVGTILVEDLPLITQTMQLETEPFSENWRMVKYCDSFALDRKIRAAGWNFFFMAARVQVMFMGPIRSSKLKNALIQILKKTKHENFNGLEVTQIITKHFLRIPTPSSLRIHVTSSAEMVWKAPPGVMHSIRQLRGQEIEKIVPFIYLLPLNVGRDAVLCGVVQYLIHISVPV